MSITKKLKPKTRARPIRFFWADTNVFQFSLLIPNTNTDIFVLLKQYLFCLMRQNNNSSYFAFSQTF